MDSMLGRLIRLIVTVPSEMFGVLCDLAEKLASNRGSEWYSELARFLRKEPCWVIVTKTVETTKVFFKKRLFDFTLGEAKNLPSPRKVFRAYFDQNFEKCGISFSGTTSEIKVAVDELIMDGKFSDFLGATAMELEKCRLVGSQFLAICRDHPDKLQGNGYANFFVLTRNDESVAEDLSNVFVAYVFVYGVGKLNAHLYHVSDDYFWGGDGGHRIFSPQQ